MPQRTNTAGHSYTLGRSPRCGFTLVELLVATTISSLLVVSVVSATRALSGARRSVDRRVERSTSARRALEEIVGALRNVRCDPVAGKPVVVGLGMDRDGDGDRIDLLVISDRRSRPEGPESDQCEMSFFLARPGERRLPALMCRRDHAFDEHPGDGGIATVVAEGVVGLSFEYYADGQWSHEWSNAEPSAPEAVRVIVAAVGAGRTEPTGRVRPLVLSTVVPIRVNEPVVQQPRPQNEGPRPGGTQR